MVFYYIFRSTLLMEVIDILSDNKIDISHFLQITQSDMCLVWLGIDYQFIHILEHIPNIFGITHKCCDCCVF